MAEDVSEDPERYEAVTCTACVAALSRTQQRNDIDLSRHFRLRPKHRADTRTQIARDAADTLTGGEARP